MQQQGVQQMPQACGPGQSRVDSIRAPPIACSQWKVYILLVSAFHMPLQHTHLDWFLGFLFNWIMEYADVCHTIPLLPPPTPPTQPAHPLLKLNWRLLLLLLLLHVNYQAQCIDLTANTCESIYSPIPLPLPSPLPLSRLHWLRFQNCKLDLLNFSKLQQQEANRQRLAKVLPKSLQPIITWKITHTHTYTPILPYTLMLIDIHMYIYWLILKWAVCVSSIYRSV